MNNPSYSVFISYPREHRLVASLLSGYVRSTNALCSYDLDCVPAGEFFSPIILGKISSSQELLIILTPEFLLKKWLDFEVSAAVGAGALVVPLLYGVEANAVAKHELLRGRQALSIYDYSLYLQQLANRVDGFKQSHVRKLQEGITRALGRGRP